MKKLFTLLAALLFFAPLTQAALKVVNKTGQAIYVAIEGHVRHPDSLNSVKIANRSFHIFNLGGKDNIISGPLRFAFSKDMGKPQYYFFETNYCFPIKGGTIKTVVIKTTGKETYVDAYDQGKVKKLPVIFSRGLKRGSRTKVGFTPKKTSSRTAVGIARW